MTNNDIYADYAAFTESTAFYPAHVAAEYLALGLCSEAAECLEVFHTRALPEFIRSLGPEVGDCQWYATRLALIYDFTLTDLTRDAFEMQASIHDVETLLGKLSIQSGLIAGKIKKQLRDGSTWTGEEREEARKYIRDRLVRVIRISSDIALWLHSRGLIEYGSYPNLLRRNREKLESRKARNTLGGNGDNR